MKIVFVAIEVIIIQGDQEDFPIPNREPLCLTTGDPTGTAQRTTDPAAKGRPVIGRIADNSPVRTVSDHVNNATYSLIYVGVGLSEHE